MYCYYKNQEACRDAKNHEPTEKQDIYKAKLFLSAFLITSSKYTSPKWPWSTWKASFMYLRLGNSLLSTPWPFWTHIFILISQSDDEKHCFLK